MSKTITASIVRQLRERTGSGMMDCKRALQKVDGDIEKAIDEMRRSGMTNAAKKAGRVATEGLINIRQNKEVTRMAIVEINSETDFVAKDQIFKDFCSTIAERVLDHQPLDIDALMKCPSGDGDLTIEQFRQQLVSQVGENINVRRFSLMNSDTGGLSCYLHGSRIGVLVRLNNDDSGLAKDIAMHIAASNPLYVSEEDVPKDVLDRESSIFRSQARESGKPSEIVEKMVAGRTRKFLQEITLLGQAFIKDTEQSVAELLEATGASVKDYVRYEVGEGLTKHNNDFATEVMAQVKGE